MIHQRLVYCQDNFSHLPFGLGGFTLASHSQHFYHSSLLQITTPYPQLNIHTTNHSPSRQKSP
jgi:hypothetical protein